MPGGKSKPPNQPPTSIAGLGKFAVDSARKALAESRYSDGLEWVTTDAAKGPEATALEMELRYRYGSELASVRRFGEAETNLSRATTGRTQFSHFAQERLALLHRRKALELDLEVLRERFGKPCPKCSGRDMYLMATCSHQLSPVPRAIKLPPRYLSPVIEQVYAAAAYRSGWDPDRQDPLSVLLRLAKRTIDRVALRTIGLLLSDYLAYHTHLCSKIDVVVPVPTSREREENRGGGIPFELALTLRDSLKIPLRESVFQVQSHLDHSDANPVERRRSLRTAWRVKADSLLRGSQILLVDDVLTTGTTMRTAAEVGRLTIRNRREWKSSRTPH